MTTNHTKELKHAQKLTSELKNDCPGVMEALGNLHQEVMLKGTLPLKTKELIAIGISIAIKCNSCIQGHVKAALDAGASPQEIYETVGVAILMGGGPGKAYGTYAIEAMNQYLKE